MYNIIDSSTNDAPNKNLIKVKEVIKASKPAVEELEAINNMFTSTQSIESEIYFIKFTLIEINFKLIIYFI